MLPLSDTTMQAVEYALRGIAMRQDVHAHNIANNNTPNYLAERVEFEAQLRDALDKGRLDDIQNAKTVHTNDFPDALGNTVELATEMTGLVKNNLIQDAMVNSYNFKVNILRSAIGRR